MPPTDSLDVELEGAVNFREVTTVVVDGGRRRLRRGLLYRSGATHRMAPAVLEHLARDRGVRSVIDLRTEFEVVNVGRAPFEAAGITHYHAPMQDPADRNREARAERLEQFRTGRFDWAACYLRVAGAHHDQLRRAFELAAGAAEAAIVVHCAAGRDRTGVTIALLLAALGADPDDIADDYHLSGERLVRHVELFMKPYNGDPSRLTREEVVRLLDTERASMVRFLDGLAEAYGSIAAYLATIGVGEALITSLRERFLEPVPAEPTAK